MKKLLVIVLLISLVCGTVFANGAKEPGATAKSDAMKVALIIENTIDDKGWCQAMHDGIIAAQAQMPGKIEYSYSENMPPVDAGSIARQYVADGYDLIIAHGAQYKNLILEMAGEYPDVSFAFGTSAEIGPANVFTYMPESEETGYLSGLIAGLTTKSNIVGVVGPVDGGDAARYCRGFVLGAKAVNPNCKIQVAHTGSFSDYVKAGEVATSQIRNGADVLTGASQQAIGALRATAEAPNAMWVGQDIAQFSTEEGKKKCIAASAYNYAAVIVGLVNKLEAGVKGGECIPMNFNNNGFIFEFNPELAAYKTPGVAAAIDSALAQFRAKSGVLADWSKVDYSTL
ncbi:MAG: BMP family ABC transporter substrate-binding protein [Sphaerochaetaceae bacterium]|nr:BMP family ABC transporter substrate-binding protein [Sphaerochaetaceae bacterium]